MSDLTRFDPSPLSRVADLYGNAALVESAPLSVCHRDILYVPAGTSGTSPGLFDRGRKMLSAAADYRATPNPVHPYDAFTTLDPEDFEYAADDVNYVFLGALTGHYGHFITASMARLWPARLASDPLTRYVILNQHHPASFFEIKFIEEILGAVGVTYNNTLSFSQPVRFREITVPSPAIEEHNFSHRIFGSLCARIGDLLSPARLPTNDTPVFLSKAKLQSGVSKVVNELEVCACLESAGVEVFYPETMSLSEQISLFRSRSIITGWAGSGMHTGVFAQNRDRLALAVSSHLFTNQLLLDQASGCTTTTYKAETIVEPEMTGWQTGYRLSEPTRVASAFLGLIERELKPRVERRRKVGGTAPDLEGRRVLDFRFGNDTAKALEGFDGWYDVEPNQCWTLGSDSFLDLVLHPSQGDLTLQLLVGTVICPPHLISRPLTVFAGGIKIAHFLVDRLKTYACSLPRKCLDGDVLHLRFEHLVTTSPRDLWGDGDDRHLSISFERITVKETII